MVGCSSIAAAVAAVPLVESAPLPSAAVQKAAESFGIEFQTVAADKQPDLAFYKEDSAVAIV